MERERLDEQEAFTHLRRAARSSGCKRSAVAAEVAAWALEQAAHRAEARNQASPASRRLRQGADSMQRFGRGPLADRLRQRPDTTITWRQQPPQPDQHRG
jgi:ANTAR domain